MKLSIIVPVYNVASYLPRCVDSILAQTLTDFELILVDDGSTDESGNICDEYAQKDGRVIVIHKDNGGQSSARNTGLDIAQGEYVGFVDGDDYIDKEMYLHMYNLAKKSAAGIVTCGYACVDELTGEGKCYPDLSADLEVSKEAFFCDYFAKYKYYVFTSVWNKIMRREYFESVRFPEGRIYEDEYVIPYLFSQAEKIYISRNTFYKYVSRNGSTLQSPYSKKQLDLLYMGADQYYFFTKNSQYLQQEFAQDAFVSYYMKNYFAITLHFPQHKRELGEYRVMFRKMLPSVIVNPQICRLKKLCIALMLIIPRKAHSVVKHYFPECLFGFMQ